MAETMTKTMTKPMEEEAEQRCPKCGITVRLTDVRCPRCEHTLYYGYNLNKDKKAFGWRYRKLPRGFRAAFLAITLGTLITGIAMKSPWLIVAAVVVFFVLLVMSKRANLACLLFGRLGLMAVEPEPWDKTMFDPRTGQGSRK